MRTAAVLATLVAVLGGAEITKHDSKPARPPIVFVVFDAFPESMLMKPGGEIDAERFPGFAELTRGATWYRNATTVHDSTIKSIPAMLDGRWPSNKRRPVFADHPVNLFTLLNPTYRVWADEEGTQLCPRAVCKEKPARLLYLLHGRREQRFAAALGQIGAPSPDKRPGLWFAHVLLPHEPLRFLPDGKVYEGGADPEPGLDGNESFDNEFLTHQAEERHLLQVEYTDTLVRQLLARLHKTGLYDKALVIVTADHGISFRVKGSPAPPYKLGQIGWRRDLTTHNAHDVAFVPMFVKAPGQKAGAINDSWVRTTDILPTILRAAHLKRMPTGLAGKPLGVKRRVPGTLHVLTNLGKTVTLDPPTLDRRRAATVVRRARRFSTGADVDRIFRVGPGTALISRTVSSLGHAGRARASARFWGARRFLDVDLHGHEIPSNVIGTLPGSRRGDHDLAVAVNGRIAAVGRSVKPIGKLGLEFSLLVPESAFRQGYNEVRLYEVMHGSRLVELGRTPRR